MNKQKQIDELKKELQQLREQIEVLENRVCPCFHPLPQPEIHWAPTIPVIVGPTTIPTSVRWSNLIPNTIHPTTTF